MSGFEVVGVVLGVLPIVLQSVQIYHDSIGMVSTLMGKRRCVEKLACALLLQQSTLHEMMESIINASGCGNVLALDDDPFQYFQDDYVQQEVEDFLGRKNNLVFVNLIKSNMDIVRKVAKNVSGLIPGYNKPMDDLVAIIHANKEKRSLLVDIMPRIKLLLRISDMKSTIQEIDAGTAALDRFHQLIISNRQAVQDTSSKRPTKLAKALDQVRKSISGLHFIMLDHFRKECHDHHETRLYLEDRVNSASELLSRLRNANFAAPLLAINLSFTVGTVTFRQDKKFYDAVVQVFREEEGKDLATTPILDSESLPGRQSRLIPMVTFTPDRSPSPARPVVATVTSICSAIQEAHQSNRRISFALLGTRQIGSLLNESRAPQEPHTGSPETLKLAEVLENNNMTFPWKFRMLLALRLASSLLQLLQTRWLEGPWTKDAVHFVVHPVGSATPQQAVRMSHTPLQADLERPFVACTFDSTQGEPKTVEPKLAMLELGILLLEIWHKTTLERRFGVQKATTSYYDRMARAVEWLDDVDEPLLDLYDKVVAHCLRGNIGGDTRFVDWNDTKLRNSVCENIIEPLSTICKQWDGQ